MLFLSIFNISWNPVLVLVMDCNHVFMCRSCCDSAPLTLLTEPRPEGQEKFWHYITNHHKWDYELAAVKIQNDWWFFSACLLHAALMWAGIRGATRHWLTAASNHAGLVSEIGRSYIGSHLKAPGPDHSWQPKWKAPEVECFFMWLIFVLFAMAVNWRGSALKNSSFTESEGRISLLQTARDSITVLSGLCALNVPQ